MHVSLQPLISGYSMWCLCLCIASQRGSGVASTAGRSGNSSTCSEGVGERQGIVQ